MEIKILPSASEDLIDGYWFYQRQEEGLGRYFLSSLSSDIESLKDNAGIHRVFFEKYHRKLSEKFPYSIYYVVEDDYVIVKAVLDCRKNPKSIKRRLKS